MKGKAYDFVDIVNIRIAMNDTTNITIMNDTNNSTTVIRNVDNGKEFETDCRITFTLKNGRISFNDYLDK